ncbi:hypothetical protein ACIVBQ_001249 [Tenacibaculum discolor]
MLKFNKKNKKTSILNKLNRQYDNFKVKKSFFIQHKQTVLK